MFGLGPAEMAIIGIIGVLLFGNKLPAMAKNLGSAIPSFKKGLQGIEDEVSDIKKQVTA